MPNNLTIKIQRAVKQIDPNFELADPQGGADLRSKYPSVMSLLKTAAEREREDEARRSERAERRQARATSLVNELSELNRSQEAEQTGRLRRYAIQYSQHQDDKTIFYEARKERRHSKDEDRKNARDEFWAERRKKFLEADTTTDNERMEWWKKWKEVYTREKEADKAKRDAVKEELEGNRKEYDDEIAYRRNEYWWTTRPNQYRNGRAERKFQKNNDLTKLKHYYRDEDDDRRRQRQEYWDTLRATYEREDNETIKLESKYWNNLSRQWQESDRAEQARRNEIYHTINEEYAATQDERTGKAAASAYYSAQQKSTLAALKNNLQDVGSSIKRSFEMRKHTLAANHASNKRKIYRAAIFAGKHLLELLQDIVRPIGRCAYRALFEAKYVLVKLFWLIHEPVSRVAVPVKEFAHDHALSVCRFIYNVGHGALYAKKRIARTSWTLIQAAKYGVGMLMHDMARVISRASSSIFHHTKELTQDAGRKLYRTNESARDAIKYALAERQLKRKHKREERNAMSQAVQSYKNVRNAARKEELRVAKEETKHDDAIHQARCEEDKPIQTEATFNKELQRLFVEANYSRQDTYTSGCFGFFHRSKPEKAPRPLEDIEDVLNETPRSAYAKVI